MRKFATSLKNFVKIPNDTLINVEIQNSFRGVHEKELEYLQSFTPNQNRIYLGFMDPQLFEICLAPDSEI